MKYRKNLCYINKKAFSCKIYLSISNIIPLNSDSILKLKEILHNHWYIEPPDFPRNLHVIEKGSRHINLGWTTSQDGNSPITQYIIEYKTESGKHRSN